MSGVSPKRWLGLARSMTEKPSPSEVEEARLLEQEIIERSCALMIGALVSPKVITWEDMVSAATKEPDYVKVPEIVLNGGEGPWPTGTEGIRK